MKLWQIKAMSLRIMFADTDIQFSEEEFLSGALYENANTGDKLKLMDDSIRRAIDLYYHTVGSERTRKEFILDESNQIDLSNEEFFGNPERVDINIYQSGQLVVTQRQISYVYDRIANKIYLDREYNEEAKAIVWYKTRKLNIPYDADYHSFDLDSIYIPEDVQRMIPYYVKGELYEEDEPSMAMSAMGMYMNFLATYKRPFSKVQTKVIRSRIFDKDN